MPMSLEYALYLQYGVNGNVVFVIRPDFLVIAIKGPRAWRLFSHSAQTNPLHGAGRNMDVHISESNQTPLCFRFHVKTCSV